MKKVWYYIIPALLTFSVASCGGDEAASDSEYEKVKKKNEAEAKEREAEEAKREAEEAEKRKRDTYETTMDAELTGEMKDYFSFDGKVKFGADYIKNTSGEPIVKFKLVRNKKPFDFDMSETYIRGGNSSQCPKELKFELVLMDGDGAPIDIGIEFPLYGGTKDLYTVKAGEDLWISSPDGYNDHLIVGKIVEQKENIKSLSIKTYIGENYAYGSGGTAYRQDEDESDESSEYGDDGNFGGGESSEWLDEYEELLEDYLDIVSNMDDPEDISDKMSEISDIQTRAMNLAQKIQNANPSAQDLKRFTEIQAKFTKAAAKMGGY